MTERSGSEKRKALKALSVRVTPEEYAAIEAKAAASSAKTIAQYVRQVSLGHVVTSRTDLQLVNELRRLGGLQKKLYNSAATDEERRGVGEVLLEIVEAVRRIGA